VDIAGDIARDDAAACLALASYDIGTVPSVDRLLTGGSAVRKVTTAAGAYLLKPAWDQAVVALLAELPGLASHGVRQPAIIRTAAGNLVSPNGYFLQEFLAGQPELEPSEAQVLAVMRAVGELHAALERLSACYEPDQNSVYVQVTNPAFLTGELPNLMRHFELVTHPAKRAVSYLAEHQAASGRCPAN
jgi:Ser/Thr protein kinase RdoA (MazF antagonist)